MKGYLSLLFILFSGSLIAQQDTTQGAKILSRAPYTKNSLIATVSIGFSDNNRQTYTLPAGFSKGDVSGFAPVFAKVEYGLTESVSLGATVGYDGFVYNNLQKYTGNNGAFTRYKTNNTRIFSGGLTAFYHLASVLHSHHFDPFIGAGLSLNNIRYHAYPQGDSTAIRIDHTVTPYLKVGTRYFISNQFSLFGDIGYDQQAMLTLGFSCRFFNIRRL